MRSTCTALLLATLVVGCKNSKKEEPPAAAPSGAPAAASGAAKPADDMKPGPVAKDPAAGATVRSPVAADLAEYTKDITGAGPLMATIDTNLGAFHCQLFDDKAPATVANFIGLATGKKAWRNPQTRAVETGKAFYDGLTFHRVIPGFMVQGGDPLGTGGGDPGYEFADEVNNGLTMKPGTLAMANRGPNTNGSQFYITEGSPTQLENKYSIFGLCKEVDLVKKIAGVPRNRADRPDVPVTITKITFAKS